MLAMEGRIYNTLQVPVQQDVVWSMGRSAMNNNRDFFSPKKQFNETSDLKDPHCVCDLCSLKKYLEMEHLYKGKPPPFLTSWPAVRGRGLSYILPKSDQQQQNVQPTHQTERDKLYAVMPSPLGPTPRRSGGIAFDYKDLPKLVAVHSLRSSPDHLRHQLERATVSPTRRNITPALQQLPVIVNVSCNADATTSSVDDSAKENYPKVTVLDESTPVEQQTDISVDSKTQESHDTHEMGETLKSIKKIIIRIQELRKDFHGEQNEQRKRRILSQILGKRARLNELRLILRENQIITHKNPATLETINEDKTTDKHTMRDKETEDVTKTTDDTCQRVAMEMDIVTKAIEDVTKTTGDSCHRVAMEMHIVTKATEDVTKTTDDDTCHRVAMEMDIVTKATEDVAKTTDDDTCHRVAMETDIVTKAIEDVTKTTDDDTCHRVAMETDIVTKAIGGVIKTTDDDTCHRVTIETDIVARVAKDVAKATDDTDTSRETKVVVKATEGDGAPNSYSNELENVNKTTVDDARIVTMDEDRVAMETNIVTKRTDGDSSTDSTTITEKIPKTEEGHTETSRETAMGTDNKTTKGETNTSITEIDANIITKETGESSEPTCRQDKYRHITFLQPRMELNIFDRIKLNERRRRTVEIGGQDDAVGAKETNTLENLEVRDTQDREEPANSRRSLETSDLIRCADVGEERYNDENFNDNHDVWTMELDESTPKAVFKRRWKRVGGPFDNDKGNKVQPDYAPPKKKADEPPKGVLKRRWKRFGGPFDNDKGNKVQPDYAPSMKKVLLDLHEDTAQYVFENTEFDSAQQFNQDATYLHSAEPRDLFNDCFIDLPPIDEGEEEDAEESIHKLERRLQFRDVKINYLNQKKEKLMEDLRRIKLTSRDA